MKKQTIIDQIEIKPCGTIQVRFAKQIVDSDGTVLSSDWHRTMLPPGHDIDAQMAAVNAHLGTLKCKAVDCSEIDTMVRPLLPIVWTDKRVKAHRDQVEAQRQEHEAAEARAKAGDESRRRALAEALKS